jgi:hypothetical protein
VREREVRGESGECEKGRSYLGVVHEGDLDVLGGDEPKDINHDVETILSFC